MKTPALRVEVAYASPERSICRQLSLPKGSTVGDAIRACGVLKDCTEVNLTKNRVGIFGRLVSQTMLLRDGDRVEIYRPLKADPKEARRRRASIGRRAGKS